MRFLRKLFDGGASPEPGDSEVGISAVRARLEEQLPGSPEAARLLNQLADLELARGERGEALRCYGKSIDAHMELGQFDAAGAICRKLLRLLPDVVRARCTLAWLSVGKGLLEPAMEYVDGYVAAAVAGGQEKFARQQLRLMGQCVADSSFRRHLAGRLRELDDEEGATAIEQEVLPGTLPTPAEIGWNPVVFAALLTPEELEEAKRSNLDLRSPTFPQEDDFPIYRPSDG